MFWGLNKIIHETEDKTLIHWWNCFDYVIVQLYILYSIYLNVVMQVWIMSILLLDY